MGGVPAWADRESRKKSKQAASDSKETFYCSNATCCACLFNLWKKDLFWGFDKSLCEKSWMVSLILSFGVVLFFLSLFL